MENVATPSVLSSPVDAHAKDRSGCGTRWASDAFSDVSILWSDSAWTAGEGTAARRICLFQLDGDGMGGNSAPRSGMNGELR